jgi:hypothetical protein
VQSRQHDITLMTSTLTSSIAFRPETELLYKIHIRSGQEDSSRKFSMQPTGNRDETLENSNTMDLPAIGLGDDFAIPDDFILGFLPVSDSQGLNIYSYLDLDGYSFNELPSIDLDPNLGTFQNS